MMTRIAASLFLSSLSFAAACDIPLSEGDWTSRRPGDSHREADPPIACPAIGCGPELTFEVPSWHERFGADARHLEVSACLDGACGSSEVTLETGASSSRPLPGSGDVSAIVDLQGSLQITLSLRRETRGGLQGRTVPVTLKVARLAGDVLVVRNEQVNYAPFEPSAGTCQLQCESATVTVAASHP